MGQRRIHQSVNAPNRSSRKSTSSNRSPARTAATTAAATSHIHGTENIGPAAHAAGSSTIPSFRAGVLTRHEEGSRLRVRSTARCPPNRPACPQQAERERRRRARVRRPRPVAGDDALAPVVLPPRALHWGGLLGRHGQAPCAARTRLVKGKVAWPIRRRPSPSPGTAREFPPAPTRPGLISLQPVASRSGARAGKSVRSQPTSRTATASGNRRTPDPAAPADRSADPPPARSCPPRWRGPA